KGFALGLDKPLLGIPSLDILAKNVSTKEEALVCPLIDARRNLVYSCLYKVKGNKFRKISKYLLISPDALLKKLKPGEKTIFLGDGLKLYQDLIFKKLGKNAIFLDEKLWYPKAGNILDLAQGSVRKKKLSNALKVEPLYLYPKECQIKKR
ncbi:MAG: tRNA (adenosine(37)-N6)-threonylcarbamoyltransferase complex dimerization subunit type 1 TsaB, partial [Candidatus Omnitrophica bacterium]|nr:tRNA (adenosine(37)-N6)-threonylcarbamoyltransferase complex dimerization subunit type 1 TsaB [Candidatus Omnitrophota bacterium]